MALSQSCGSMDTSAFLLLSKECLAGMKRYGGRKLLSNEAHDSQNTSISQESYELCQMEVSNPGPLLLRVSIL